MCLIQMCVLNAVYKIKIFNHKPAGKKNSDNWLFIALKLPNYTTIEMCSENNA